MTKLLTTLRFILNHTKHFNLEVIAKGIEKYFNSLTIFLIYIRKLRSRGEKMHPISSLSKQCSETGTELRNFDLGASGSYTRISTDISFPARVACQKFATLCSHLTIDLLRDKAQGTESSSISRRFSKHVFSIFT